MKTPIPKELLNHRDPRVAAMYRGLAVKGQTPHRTAKPTSAARSKPAIQAKAATVAEPIRAATPKAENVAPRKAASAPPKRGAVAKLMAQFDHLVPAPDAVMPSEAVATPPEMSKQAAAILKAAAKAKTVTGTGAKPPSGLAARILAAGRKARGEA